MSLSRKTLEHPVLILIVFALLGMIGIFTLSNVAIALMPEVENPSLSISTTYPNADPESVEKTITKMIESAVMSVNGLKNLTSTSSEGSSNVSLEFEYGTNLDQAMNDIRDKLDRVKRALPDNAGTPTIFRFSGDNGEIMRILIRGNRSVDDLKAIAESNVVSILEQADGVGEAEVYGGRTAQVNVRLDQNRMAAYGFTVPTVTSALSKQNLELGGGKVQEGHRNYIVRTTGEYTSLDEINDTVITIINGYSIRLSDIGEASIGYADVTQESFINGEKGVYISVTKQSDANSVTVANNVYKKIDQAQNNLPPDVTLEIIRDSTDSIRETINTLIQSAWQGLVLAVIILFIFLQNFKSTIIISISIPLSIIITLFAMGMFGLTLNMMTLTGLILGVGMIVDASIVMIDNIFSYRQRGAKPRTSAVLGSQEMLMSVISGNLTTICVFIPFIFFIKDLGFMGQMFKGAIFTIVIALVSSLLVAIFLVPVLAGKFLPLSNRNEKPVRNPVLKAIYGFFERIIQFFIRVYSRILKAALDNRIVTIFAAVCILVISFAFIPGMQINQIPAGRDDQVQLNISMATATPFEETREVVLAMEAYVREECQGIKTITTSIGGRYTNRGSITIALPETAKQIDSASEMQNKLRRHFSEFPSARFTFSEGFRGQWMGSSVDIVLLSDDLDAALDTAEAISDVLYANDKISEPTVSMDKGLPEVEIVIDRERAYSMGVDIATVAREINYAINGSTACTYRSNGTDYSVVVAYRPEDRKTINDLESIYVRGNGGMVSVANFASIKKGLGPVSIRRESQKRIIHVRASNISDENDNVIEEEIRAAVQSSVIIPDSVIINYDGAWKDTVSQYGFYLRIAIMAVLLVFGVMAATYESFKAPLINLATMPFIVIGVILIHKIIGEPLSFMTAIGIIMLIGIVVNNGIILVDYTNILVGRGVALKDACYQAGKSRFRPVLMTTLTTVLGMLPMCFATSGQSSMVRPIAIAVVGGLISSTFVTLLVIPVLYSLVMRKRKEV
ncbi:MAG: efflux RND transporter permease subunit [Treponema sp.]|nr:efflux RND transporter permease subunit [Treponema sp.]